MHQKIIMMRRSGDLLIEEGDLLVAKDTIRSWFPTPLYKVYILDQNAEENMGANQFNVHQGQ